MRKTMTIALIAFIACKKPVPVPVVEEPVAAAPVVDTHSDEAHKAIVEQLGAQFGRVHFELDSDKLTEASKTALSANAKILQEHPRITVRISGHADERGTTDYNLALGQRRATNVQGYITSLGIDKARVPVISMGEEDPLVKGHDESAWSANRRCEFQILVGEKGVSGTTP